MVVVDGTRTPLHAADPVDMLSRAVQNGRTLAADPSTDVDMDTVGQRLLGLALAQLAAGDGAGAAKSLAEAVEIHTQSRDWPSLVRIAKVLLGRQEELSNWRALAELSAESALTISRESPGSSLYDPYKGSTYVILYDHMA